MGRAAALGFRTHSGWAALVAAAGDPRAPSVVLRRRIELADAEIEGSMQPYHAAEELGLPAARRLIRRLEKASLRLAISALRSAIADVEREGLEIAACGLLLSSGRPLGTLTDTLASHAKIHTADGEHFRNAIVGAAEFHGLPVVRAREREVSVVAARALRLPAGVLERRISALGRSVGPPWRLDEKLATAVACLALGSLRP